MTLEGEEVALPGHTSCPHVLRPFLARRAKSHLLLAQLLAVGYFSKFGLPCTYIRTTKAIGIYLLSSGGHTDSNFVL